MMMLIGVVANPVAVWISPGRRRLPMLAGVLMLAGVVVCVIPSSRRFGVLPICAPTRRANSAATP